MSRTNGKQVTLFGVICYLQCHTRRRAGFADTMQ